MQASSMNPGESGDVTTTQSVGAQLLNGPWVASFTFRPWDGGPEQAAEAYGSTESYAAAEAQSALDRLLGRVQTMAPDSAASRRLIEAASHNADLQEARTALDLAKAAEGDARRFLVVYAVIAYCRTFGSNVRADLTDFIAFSEQDEAVHERLKVLRNRFAAHSENTMAVTYPLLNLSRPDPRGDVSAISAMAMTVTSGVPDPFVRELSGFVDRAIASLKEALEPIKAEALRIEQGELRDLFENPVHTRMVAVDISEWTPHSRRARYPESADSPVHIEIPPAGSGPADN